MRCGKSALKQAMRCNFSADINVERCDGLSTTCIAKIVRDFDLFESVERD
jgi:hypothetical protein